MDVELPNTQIAITVPAQYRRAVPSLQQGSLPSSPDDIFGGAMIFGPSIAILTSVFPSGEKGSALGINVASVYLGLSAGPFRLALHFPDQRSPRCNYFSPRAMEN